MKLISKAIIGLLPSLSLCAHLGFAQAAKEAIDSLETLPDRQLPVDPAQTQEPSPFGTNATMAAPAPEVPKKGTAKTQPNSGPAQQIPGAIKPSPSLPVRFGELNLSAEQTQTIIELRKQWRPEQEKQLKNEFTSLKQTLPNAIAESATTEEVRRQFETMQRKYLELQTLKFEKLLKIREVLNPEQRRKFAEMRNKSGSSKNASSPD